MVTMCELHELNFDTLPAPMFVCVVSYRWWENKLDKGGIRSATIPTGKTCSLTEYSKLVRANIYQQRSVVITALNCLFEANLWVLYCITGEMRQCNVQGASKSYPFNIMASPMTYHILANNICEKMLIQLCRL